ncbi:hypothetical protein [Massilia sp. Leaf139]|uniref:hypothetical protein n=1 Tax=Massilia sp. Leaf139 TaxID=1736272 RepID=UPI000700B05D|nr:hypothetical protein [Massilia sp. Leaf139]KQQ91948.1 hypothetical protein ASF77_08475 [Massilia sp. Leaf139]
MFSLDDFSKLQFLEGRWKGQSPDGKEFFEQYDRLDQRTFRSRRFSNAAFDQHSDGSTITFLDGEVLSEWGKFTWRASEIGADHATFAPVNAPSQFIWRRVDDSTLEAHQRWSTDGDGEEQHYTIRMTRL